MARTGDGDHVQPAAAAVLAHLEQRLNVGRLLHLPGSTKQKGLGSAKSAAGRAAVSDARQQVGQAGRLDNASGARQRAAAGLHSNELEEGRVNLHEDVGDGVSNAAHADDLLHAVGQGGVIVERRQT